MVCSTRPRGQRVASAEGPMARPTAMAPTLGMSVLLFAATGLAAQGPAAPKPAEDKKVEAPRDAAVGPAPAEVKASERAIVDFKQAVGVRAVAPALAGRAVEPAVGDQDPQVQSYLQMLRPTFRAELYLARSICKPDAGQLGPIAEAAERGFLEAVKQYVKRERTPRAIETPRMQANFDRTVAEGVSAALKDCLSPEQAERYADEVARRFEEQRRTVARNLVSLFDRELFLSAEQRDRMIEELLAHWDDAWCPSLEHFQYGLRYLPRLPDGRVEPLLNTEQKVVWKDLQSRSQVSVSLRASQLDNHELEEEGKDADRPARAGVK